jgi:lipopolysaccharide export system protein LptA
MIRCGPAMLVLGLALAAPPATAATPLHVTADTFEVNDATHEATFSGNVVVTRETLTMWAAKVVVGYGPGGPSDVEDLTATGGVRIKNPELEASGERASFDPKAQKLTLSGNVRVTNASGTVNGPQLVVDLQHNTSVFSGGAGGRVTGVFTPQ